jgi:hypothetical protein
MRLPIAWALVSACLIPVFAQAADPALDGLWFGRELNGRPVNGVIRTVLIIHDDQFVVLSPIAVSRSKLHCSPKAILPEIDLDLKQAYPERWAAAVRPGSAARRPEPGTGRAGLQRASSCIVHHAVASFRWYVAAADRSIRTPIS